MDKTGTFDRERLSEALRNACDAISFALLHGSAKDGAVKEGSDIDIAIYIKGTEKLDIVSCAFRAAESVLPPVKIDIGILNDAEPVYCFEALKGKLLFARDKEVYHSFFSRTCRMYEHTMYHYEKQHAYRVSKDRARFGKK